MGLTRRDVGRFSSLLLARKAHPPTIEILASSTKPGRLQCTFKAIRPFASVWRPVRTRFVWWSCTRAANSFRRPGLLPIIRLLRCLHLPRIRKPGRVRPARLSAKDQPSAICQQQVSAREREALLIEWKPRLPPSRLDAPSPQRQCVHYRLRIPRDHRQLSRHSPIRSRLPLFPLL